MVANRIVVSILCLTLCWTAVASAWGAPVLPTLGGAVDAHPANVQVIHVTAEEYPALERRLAQAGYRQSGEQPLRGHEVPAYHDPAAPDAFMADRCDPRNQRRAGDDSLRLAVQVTEDLTSGRWGSSADAAVVFVVVGAVVVVVWTLYLFKYLYDISIGMPSCGRWSEMTLSSSSTFSGADQHARFSGLRYTTGTHDGSTHFGIVGEVGHSDIRLTDIDALQLKGTYWWVGPMLRWRYGGSANPHYFQMEFVGGSTEHDEMRLIALARAGWSFGVGDALRWGLNVGAMNLQLRENNGLISDRNRYYYLLGLELGYRF